MVYLLWTFEGDGVDVTGRHLVGVYATEAAARAAAGEYRYGPTEVEPREPIGRLRP